MEKNFDAINNVDGNSYTTEFRQYDPRLGRWLSLDPLTNVEPGWSPYRAFFDNPIIYTDPDGLYETWREARKAQKLARDDGYSTGKIQRTKGGKYYFQVTNSSVVGAEVFVTKYSESIEKTMPSDRSSHLNNTQSIDGHNYGNEYNQYILNQSKAPVVNPLDYAPTIGPKRDVELEISKELFHKYTSKAIPYGGVLDKKIQGEEVTTSDWVWGTVELIPAGKVLRPVKVLTKTKAGKAVSKVLPAGGCFISGTKILSENGLISIDIVKVGDKVWAYDTLSKEKSLKIVYSTVVRESRHLQKLIIEGDTLFTTEEHPFYLNNNWVFAKDLKINDSLLTINGNKVCILSNQRIDTLVKVYNFAVTDFANYYVGNLSVLAHNNDPCQTVIKKTAAEIAKNAKKMSENQITQLLGEGWHKNGSKTKLVKKFGKELKGSTNADFYIVKETGEVLLKGNKSNAWVETGMKLEL
jgi:RHS repeat-associated protein